MHILINGTAEREREREYSLTVVYIVTGINKHTLRNKEWMMM